MFHALELVLFSHGNFFLYYILPFFNSLLGFYNMKKIEKSNIYKKRGGGNKKYLHALWNQSLVMSPLKKDPSLDSPSQQVGF
jgi:hypothetical protein